MAVTRVNLDKELWGVETENVVKLMEVQLLITSYCQNYLPKPKS